jgi:hypothetical protein
VELGSRSRYVTLSERLRAVGFREDNSPGAPICRWLIDDMVWDVMPTDEGLLGFSNRWYKDALSKANEQEPSKALRIRVLPSHVVATKLEAFRGRGHDDYRASHDLEDLISAIDGREEILEEVRRANDDLKA